MALGQNQQTRVVGQQGAPAPALLEIPADELIPVFEMESRAALGRQGQPLALVGGHVTQLLPHQRGVLQIVMLDDELVTPSLVLGRTDQSDLEMVQNVLLVT